MPPAITGQSERPSPITRSLRRCDLFGRDMRGQGLNTHRFMLTSVVRKITARRLPGPRSRRPSWIRTATVANDSLGRQNRHWGGHPLPTVHGTTAPRLLAAPTGAPPLTGRRVTLRSAPAPPPECAA